MALYTTMLAQAAVFFSSLAGAEVAKLTTENFDSFLKENPKTLVKFFAPWCGHCKSLAPHYEEASDKLPEGVKLAEVDATEEPTLATRFGVKGYPTIKWFDNGADSEYDGGRTSDTILQWIDSMTSDPITAFMTVSDARTAHPGSNLIVSSAKADSAEYKTFAEIAESNRALGKFIHVTGDHSDATAVEMSLYGKDSSTPQNITVAGAENEVLVKFLKFGAVPLFGDISQETYPMYADTNRQFLWVAGTTEEKSVIAPVFEAFAKKYQDKYSVVYMDLASSKQQVDRMIASPVYPVLAVMNEGGPGRFVLNNEDFTVEKIEKFLEQIEANEIEPYMKSEPVPETNDGPVKTLVGYNFKELMQKDKDVLVKIYAPWCGHCKTMAPDYIKVAEQLIAAGSDIVITEIDGTANEFDTRAFAFQGFPTIYWKKANTMPVLYSGERDAAGIMEFLMENATTPFKMASAAVEGQDEL